MPQFLVRQPRPSVQLLISVALVGPFIVLQAINRWTLHEEFPYVLFAFMTFHSLLIVLLVAPVVGSFRAHGDFRSLKKGQWAGPLLAAVLAYAYVAVVIDQMPCFLGVPNCD